MTETDGVTSNAAELEQKRILKKYLADSREALVWKLEGLTEKQARWPLVSSGNNLLGIVKHCATTDIGYFGECLGRRWPTPEELVSDEQLEADPQADWYATQDESIASVVDLYRRSWAFCDEAIDMLPLDAPGYVPWWGREVTLFRLIVHVTDETARHTGHADILREMTDRTVGLNRINPNLPDWQQGETERYVDTLKALAESAGTGRVDE